MGEQHDASCQLGIKDNKQKKDCILCMKIDRYLTLNFLDGFAKFSKMRSLDILSRGHESGKGRGSGRRKKKIS